MSDDYTEPKPRDDYDGIVDQILAAAQDLATLAPEARREALAKIDDIFAIYRG